MQVLLHPEAVPKDQKDLLRFGVVPKWLRELSAKQLCTGSTPVHALILVSSF